MKLQKKALPIGIDNFEKLRTDEFYYVDKTGLIRDLLYSKPEVTLFTRPRRFGKSLAISMLENFFSLKGDKHIFDGLKITEEIALCEKYMGKYPVISLSLKDVEATNYENAFQMAVMQINRAARQKGYLLHSNALSEEEKTACRKLQDSEMTEAVLCDSLRLLSELLEKHHGKKVILLIDEYDVPLAKANSGKNKYYDQMVSLLRRFFSATLKTNTSLKFAVVTGCLRVSKESIFTGMNNLNVVSITDKRFDEYFGFTDEEVQELLRYYDLMQRYEDTKRWYDGYQFGNQEVYCPWDVLNYCSRLLADPNEKPGNYWIDTSGNDVVMKLMRKSADKKTKDEIERLVAGEIIEKKIQENLTYAEIEDRIDNLWSLLFMSGYLTKRGETEDGLLKLSIPNLEVREIYVARIVEYFDEVVRKDGDTLNRFCDALKNGDAKSAETLFTKYLGKRISIRDTATRNHLKENFYHGVLIGILGIKETWTVTSNQETGEGYADVLIETDDEEEIGIVIELKYANDGDMDAACRRALAQIEDTNYAQILEEDGIQTILQYGIACYKKRCKVMVKKQDSGSSNIIV